MPSRTDANSPIPSPLERVNATDWDRVSQELNSQGNSVLEGFLSSDECAALAELYGCEELLRSRVVMARHGFGRGDYKYFDYPLPGLIERLRTQTYRRLVPIANR